MRPLLLALLAIVGGPAAYMSLPPDQLQLVEHILAAASALSAVLALVRPGLNYLPAGSRVRWVVEQIDKALNYLATNSTPLADRIASKPKAKSGPPFGFVLMLALPLLLSCTPHAAARMRSALEALRSMQTPAQEIAERACTAQHGQDAPQCATVHDVFEAVRTLREEAEKLDPPVDAGADAAP